jgi:transposase
MAGEFWLSEGQWGAIGPLLPKNQPGARRTDDRRVISGIVHVLKTGLSVADGPAIYGPSTTVYNRFRRWTMRAIWRRLFDAQAIGRSRGGRTTKIHAIVDARGRPIAIEVTPGHLGDVRVATALITGVPAGGCLAADAAYDSDGLRCFLLERGTVPVIPNDPTRKRHHPFDETAYRQRNLIERMFCRLKHWRRIAARYELPANFAAAVMLAAVIIWWT